MLCRPATSAREQFGKSRHSVLLFLQPFKGSFTPPPFLPAPAMDPMDTTHVEDRVLAILGSLNDARANPQELPAEPVGVHRGTPATHPRRREARAPPVAQAAPRALQTHTSWSRRRMSSSSPGQSNFVLPVNQPCEESDYVVRQAKDGFAACLNRDAHRSGRLPAMAVLNSQGRGSTQFHCRLWGMASFCGSSVTPPWPWASCTSTTSSTETPDAPSGPAQLRSH